MTDVEDLIRDSYMGSVAGRQAVIDDDTAGRLLGSARSRRRGRALSASLATVAVVAGVAFGVTQFATDAPPPATSPTAPAPTSGSPKPTPSVDADVTYVSSLPGITPVDPGTVGTALTTRVPGVPDLYPLTPEVLAQAGPGWGYTVFEEVGCTEESPASPIALVSPDGSAFLAGHLPAGICGAMPAEATGRLLFVTTGIEQDSIRLYVANVLTGEVRIVDAGMDFAYPENVVPFEGGALIGLSGKGTQSAAVAIDADGAQSIVDLGPDPGDVIWAESDGHLMFQIPELDRPESSWPWFAIAPGATAARPVDALAQSALGEECAFQQVDAAGIVYACDAGTFVLRHDGSVEPVVPDPGYRGNVTTQIDSVVPGSKDPANARIDDDFGQGPQVVIDSTELDPVMDEPWKDVAWIDTSAHSLGESTDGVVARVLQPQHGISYVVAIARPEGTLVILPQRINGALSATSDWTWWPGN